MASSSSHRDHSIERLDFDSQRQKRRSSNNAYESEQTSLLASDESFFSDVVEGAIVRDRRKMAQRIAKYLSFLVAILCCLCAGSITAFSLYGPLFISHLKYSQYQVNAVSTAAELSMYLLTPLYGWLCDRYSPRPLVAVSAFLLGGGYLLAALTYHAGPTLYKLRTHRGTDKSELELQRQGWPFTVMIIGFLGIGAGTACMYLSAVTTCAKNFGRGRHKGLALALPIACFGLSGMWQSQIGSHVFKEEMSGNIDVFRYFLFLAGLLFAVGLIGSLGLRIVNEEELVDEAVDELERSGLLDGRGIPYDDRGEAQADERSTRGVRSSRTSGYGTIDSDEADELPKPRHVHAYNTMKMKLKKRLVLRLSFPIFFRDPTMWLLAFGFFLVTGPGETYQNNIGTLLMTSYPEPSARPPPGNSPATHVSIIALASTLARLATGTITDMLAPTPSSDTHYKAGRKCTVSRIWFLLISTALFSLGQLLLATDAGYNDPETVFPISSAFVGLGYGAVFSLTPIIISCVWGVENFGTNWGTVAMVPGAGAALWSLIYAKVYQAGVGDDGSLECFGAKCYQSTFFAMAIASWVAIALWAVAWKGWRQRGVVV
ncbi:uncharacterized protein KY384_007953 [Bacidia gigantensis]|uniref:uncharacterized protein n=1 Tax=Bacidia gigantensis TaxID=2732470 RepID=UPI001D0416BB|nr:uncharacterized protein KY384_007953 [Bacidia gigantensis]KAG8527799.1 hypothetical protein KY384_007953 [Bacidia gigantensis]